MLKFYQDMFESLSSDGFSINEPDAITVPSHRRNISVLIEGICQRMGDIAGA